MRSGTIPVDAPADAPSEARRSTPDSLRSRAFASTPRVRVAPRVAYRGKTGVARLASCLARPSSLLGHDRHVHAQPIGQKIPRAPTLNGSSVSP